MKAKNINSIQDMQDFVEGCINDFESGEATKKETIRNFKDYTLRIIELSQVKSKINKSKIK